MSSEAIDEKVTIWPHSHAFQKRSWGSTHTACTACVPLKRRRVENVFQLQGEEKVLSLKKREL